MKKKILFVLIILILMITIPFFTIKDNKSFIKNYKSTNKSSEYYTKNDIYGFVSKKFREEYSTETLKAIAVIIQSNYTHNKKYSQKASDTYMSKKDFYEKYGENSSTYYAMIKKAVDSVYKLEITKDNKNIYIPFEYILRKTKGSTKFAYIKNCATPWDYINSEYKTAKKQTGISLNTLNHLCKNGYTYKDGLYYFLDDIKIQQHSNL